jgi:hypothetical protein
MEAFPFTDAEWGALKEVILPHVNAALADDDVLRASHFIQMQAALAELRGRYGDHPVLLETEADFTDDKDRAVALYRQAKETSIANGLPILSICLSLADTLLTWQNQPTEAREELLACRGELDDADEYTRKQWTELMAKCDRLLSG